MANQTTQTQPVDTVRLGNVKAAIWQNDTEAGARFNATFERLYRIDEDWRSSDSFGRDDLLLLSKVANQTHTRIFKLLADLRSAGR